MKYIGYIEIAVGVGGGIGPFLGGQIYPLIGYEYTMYVFTGFCLLGVFLGMCLIPGELN